jgi:hypothetical protein
MANHANMTTTASTGTGPVEAMAVGAKTGKAINRDNMYAKLITHVLNKHQFEKLPSFKLRVLLSNLPNALRSDSKNNVAELFMNRLSILIYNTPQIMPGYDLKSLYNLFPVTTQVFLQSTFRDGKETLSIRFGVCDKDHRFVKEIVESAVNIMESDRMVQLITRHMDMIVCSYNRKYNKHAQFKLF